MQSNYTYILQLVCLQRPYAIIAYCRCTDKQKRFELSIWSVTDRAIRTKVQVRPGSSERQKPPCLQYEASRLVRRFPWHWIRRIGCTVLKDIAHTKDRLL